MIRDEIKNLIKTAIKNLYESEIDFSIDRISDPVFGDYSTNVAMILKKNPQEIADAVKSSFLEKIEVKNDFINFFVSKEYLQKEVENVLKQKEKYGESKMGKGEKVNVEFISANPTGPLTLANGRGGFSGDVLANVLKKAGYKITKEYYINDIGFQVEKLGHSIIGDAEAVYKGKYIEDLRARIKGDNPEKVGEEGAKIILEEMIRPAVKKMGVNFDVWFSEKELYKKNAVNKALDILKKKGLAYEQEGALWFKSTQFGDDKDRVLVKADGQTTYISSDIAYLKNKFERGFKKLIFFWGADHYGYINRLKGAMEALGYDKNDIDIIIMQLVKLFNEGQEVKMSKRTGIYVAMDELLDEVGLDVARFFFLMRDSNSHLNFDMQLAKEQSQKNPVYYVQYAHARICSIISKASGNKAKTSSLQLLKEPSELELIKKLIQFLEIIEDTAKDYQTQRLPQYAMDLATAFHKFYQECQVISDDKELTSARLALISAAKIVLKNTFDLMDISTPEKM